MTATVYGNAQPTRQSGKPTASEHHSVLSYNVHITVNIVHTQRGWADDREQRFNSGLDSLICGLQTAQRSLGQPVEMSPPGPDLAR
jgi:hypothetical protein